MKVSSVPVLLEKESNPFVLYIGSQTVGKDTTREGALGEFKVKATKVCSGNEELWVKKSDENELVQLDKFIELNKNSIDRMIRLQFISAIACDCLQKED